MAADPIMKLRSLIRRKSSERDKLLQEIAQCETALLPLREQQQSLAQVDREIHQLFGELLANNSLGKRAHKQIRTVYEDLQDQEVISPEPTRATERAAVCPCPACARSDEDVPRTESAGTADPQSWPAEEESRVSKRPERQASVRDLYRKMALRFHPDRAGDDERRAEHEAVMREVNDAYHGGDTERLLMLSRELGVELGDLTQGDGLLNELVEQYERVKAEVREIRRSPLGALVTEMRRASQRGYRSPIENLEEEAEIALAQLTAARDFVRDFEQGKIDLKTFLQGPQPERFATGAPGEELLSELFEMVQQLDRAARRPNTSRRGSARRPRTR